MGSGSLRIDRLSRLAELGPVSADFSSNTLRHRRVSWAALRYGRGVLRFRRHGATADLAWRNTGARSYPAICRRCRVGRDRSDSVEPGTLGTCHDRDVRPRLNDTEA